MRAVVGIVRMSFAISTEISIVANGTFITNSFDISRLRCRRAERAITDNATVDLEITMRLRNRSIKRSKAVTRVQFGGVPDTL